MKRIRKDRVLIERIKIESKSILDIVENENEPITGKVLKKGELVEDLNVDDVVFYKESDSLPITLNGKNLFILREYDIIGIL